MTDADVLAKVLVIVEQAGPLDEKPTSNQPLFYVAAQTSSEAARAAGNYGLDSLDRVEVMMHVEEEFGVDIPEDVAAELETAGQIAAYVQVRRALASKSDG